MTLANGVASGLDALVEGAALLASGVADVVFAGGIDRLSRELAGALAEPEVVLSEGACLFVMERADHAQGRGALPLAAVAPSGDAATDEAAWDPDQRILSGAGRRRAGTVMIEHQVGQCFAALGAATVAAAIGAAWGLRVPCVNSSGEAAASATTLAVKDYRDAEGNVPASALVDGGKGHSVGVDLAVMPQR